MDAFSEEVKIGECYQCGEKTNNQLKGFDVFQCSKCSEASKIISEKNRASWIKKRDIVLAKKAKVKA